MGKCINMDIFFQRVHALFDGKSLLNFFNFKAAFLKTHETSHALIILLQNLRETFHFQEIKGVRVNSKL